MMQHPRFGNGVLRLGHRPVGTAAESVLVCLRDEILSGELAAGTKLNQAALARRFGMSRIPVRDAIRALAAEGLVTHDPHRTAVVAPLSPDDLAELYELRIAVEPHASALAVPHLTAEDLATMRAAFEVLGQADDPAGWMEAHDRFHATLYHRSGRPRMVELLDRARAQTRRYTWIRLDRDAHEIGAEHGLVLAAAERRDRRSLRVMVEAHLTASYEIVSRRLASLIGSGEMSQVEAAGLAVNRGGDARTA